MNSRKAGARKKQWYKNDRVFSCDKNSRLWWGSTSVSVLASWFPAEKTCGHDAHLMIWMYARIFVSSQLLIAADCANRKNWFGQSIITIQMSGPIEQKKEALISETSASLILYHEWGCSWTNHYGEQLCLLSLADRSLSPGERHLRENRHRYFQKHSVSSLFLNASLLAAQKSEK